MTAIRPRALLLGLALGLAICAVTPYNNFFLRGTLLGGGHFPLAPFLLFLALGLAAAVAAKLGARLLSGLELLATWAIMTVVSGIPYTGLTRTFFTNITAPLRFANVGNRWEEVLGPVLPQGLYPANGEAVRLLWEGIPRGLDKSLPELWAAIPWADWAWPLAAWGVFILLAYGLMLSLTNLLARQWVETERMDMPLLKLPKAMAQAHDENGLLGFLADRWLLLGLLVPILMHTLNGLNFYYPQVPQVPTLILAGPYFPRTGIFAGLTKLRIFLYPAFIGFAFLAPRQVSFSLWLFYLLGALSVGGLAVFGLSAPPSALGVTFGPTLAFPEETQMIGAFLVFFGFLVFLARTHIRQVLSAAFGRAPEPESGSQWFSLALSFWVFVACGLSLIAWSIFFGMGPLMALAVIVVFVIFMVVAARVICQGGIAYYTLTAAPLDALLAGLGSTFFSATGLTLAAAMQKVLFVDVRESLTPSLVHAAKVGEGAGRSSRRWYGLAIAAAVVLGVAVSFAAMLTLAHRHGLRELEVEWATRTSVTVYESVQRLLEAPAAANETILAFAAVGAVVMFVLLVCYNRFYWWPVHPLGYLAAYSSAMRILWFAFFVGWLANALTLRYGGLKLFRTIRPFFFGLILGDMLMGGIWAGIGAYTGASYMVLPD